MSETESHPEEVEVQLVPGRTTITTTTDGTRNRQLGDGASITVTTEGHGNYQFSIHDGYMKLIEGEGLPAGLVCLMDAKDPTIKRGQPMFFQIVGHINTWGTAEVSDIKVVK